MNKRPKEIDFAILIDAEGRPLVNFKGYAEALESTAMNWKQNIRF